ncbi:MAG: arsenosugar biosynthesis radical SAM protein ArsS [Desulfobacteraceae bacterium]|nr:arsenosugar biosynthesis radical SAM protein ArsS [Desulfobacteraceae bacterium]
MDAAQQRRHLSQIPGGQSFEQKLQRPLLAEDIQILQLNVGKACNLACKHCHVSAGPGRSEQMGREVFVTCLKILRRHAIGTIDVTGGAPEMNPHLPWFIAEAAKLKRRLMVRSNLAILHEEAFRHFIDLYADHQVEIITSLPHYHAQQTDRQRGSGVFAKVIDMMRVLNAKGYGRPGSNLLLHLVFNPVGAYLPGPQAALAHEYQQRLSQEHGVVFNQLFCLTNFPVGRYLEYLIRTENYEEYMSTLMAAFNWTAVQGVMCRTLLSVGWDGKLYDCDFNQMLELPVDHGAPSHIDIFEFDQLKSRQIVVANHCYACTAGAGSSCQGAIE